MATINFPSNTLTPGSAYDDGGDGMTVGFIATVASAGLTATGLRWYAPSPMTVTPVLYDYVGTMQATGPAKACNAGWNTLPFNEDFILTSGAQMLPAVFQAGTQEYTARANAWPRTSTMVTSEAGAGRFSYGPQAMLHPDMPATESWFGLDLVVTDVVAATPPTTNAGANQTNVAQGSTVTLTAVDTPGTNPISSATWTWVSGGTAPTLTGSGTTRTYTAPNAQVTQVFRRTVSDGTLVATDDVSITTAAAVPPSTNAGTDKTNVAQGSTVTLTAVDTPGTNPITTATWTWVSGGTAPTLTGSGLTRTYTAPNAQITQVFRRTVSDGTLTDTDDISVTTGAAIVPPSTSAGADQANVKPFSTVTLTAVDTPGTSPITSATWAWVSGGTAPTLSGTGTTRTYTAPIGLDAITQIFRRTVSDGTLSDIDDVSITTAPANRRIVVGGAEVPARIFIIGAVTPPSTNAGADKTNVAQGSTVTLTAVDTPGTNSITSATWAWVSGGTAPTLSGSGLTRTYTAPSSQVTQVFRRTVSDGTLTDTDDVSVTTAATVVPPSTNAGADKTNVAHGSTVTLTAVDTPGTNSITSATWTWVSGGTAPTLSGSGLSRTYTAPSTQVTQVFRRTVSDGTLTDTDDVSVTTAAVVPPSTNAGTDKTNVAQGSTVTLTAVDTPGTNPILSSSWAWVSGGTAPTLSGSGLSRTYTAPNAQVTQLFRRTVSDGTLTDTDDVFVTTAAAATNPETVTFTHGSQMLAALSAGQIGLKPGVTRTSRTPFTPVAGTTYQNLTINGDMDINVASTWINCQFISDASKPANANMWGNSMVRFEYCQFDGNNRADAGLKGQHVSVYRCEFRRCLKDAHINDDWDFTECISKEHWAKNAGDHRENILRNSGTDVSSLRCYWRMESQGSTNQYVSSAFSTYNQPESRNVTVKDNYIDGGGGGYAFYGGGTTQTSNIKVTGNIFGRAVNRYSGYAGANDSTWIGTSGYEWSNNRWGALGPANQAGDPAEGALIDQYGR